MRPKGLPRQAARDMVGLVRELLGCDYAIVTFADPADGEGVWNGTHVAYGHVSSPHEEGWSARTVEVRTTDKPGLYEVDTEDSGRDCDGSHRSGRHELAHRRKKSERFYIEGRDWQRNRPTGRFHVRTWRFHQEGRQPHVYDQFAQAAGY